MKSSRKKGKVYRNLKISKMGLTFLFLCNLHKNQQEIGQGRKLGPKG